MIASILMPMVLKWEVQHAQVGVMDRCPHKVILAM